MRGWAAWLPLVLAASAASSSPPSSSASKAAAAGAAAAASWDEVNVLAHGLLQLGHGLKEHVERTRGQLRELAARLGAHNASLARLERSAGEQRLQLGRAQRLLDGRLAELAARLRSLAAQVGAAEGGGGGGGGTERPRPQPQPQPQPEPRLLLLDGKAALRRVGAENASGGGGGGGAGARGGGQAAELSALQNLMSRQNSKIEELFQKIKQQQYRMDKQNLQIKSLQSKVNMLLPLHVKGNDMENSRWKGSAQRGPDPPANHSQSAAAEVSEASGLSTGCHQIFLDGGQSSGVYQVQPPGSQPFEVFCDMTPGGGSWTVIQKRSDGSVDFDQLWDAYRNGFGNLTGDFWLGLEKVHQIMKDGRFHLLIELHDWEGNSQKVEYLFSLGGEETAYTLSLLGPILGDLENAMGDFPQLPFSTRDRDHDLKGDTNCAKHLTGGWWFSTCGHVNLNGKYFRSIPRQRHERKQGIFWKTWRGRYYPLRATAVKIRPAELGAAS